MALPSLFHPGRQPTDRLPAIASVWAVTSLLAPLLACVESGPEDLRGETYPTWASGRESVTYEFGPGALETTGDAPWDGASYVVYPVILATDNHPVEVEVSGLDLSGIEYRGDLGWPPDGTDTGAMFQASLVGASRIAMRIYSNLSDFASAGALDHRDGFRAYRISGFNGPHGPYGTHQFGLERWESDDSTASYDTFDLRFRYQDGLVESWVRMHASRKWDEGERESGARCPGNVAINNAVPETVDAVWTGECVVPEPGATGLAVGAWVPVEGGAWSVAERPGPARVSLYLGNWAFADGPYRVSWENVRVRGVPDERFPASSGEGQLRAFGTGQAEREPRGEWASISYLASYGRQFGPSALFRYRAPAFEVEADEIEWVEVTSAGATLLGPARVNGAPGYRFEFRSVSSEGSESDSVSLRVWSPVPSLGPYFEAFGLLPEGSIEVEPGQRD